MTDNRQTITLHVNGQAHTLAVEPRTASGKSRTTRLPRRLGPEESGDQATTVSP